MCRRVDMSIPNLRIGENPDGGSKAKQSKARRERHYREISIGIGRTDWYLFIATFGETGF